MFFPESDRFGGDELLASTFGPDVIIAQTASTQTRTTSGRHVGSAQMGEDPRPHLSRWPGLVRSIDALESSAGGVGMAVIAPEIDGMVRRMPMLVAIGNEIYPNIALEALRILAGDHSYQVFTSEAGIEAVRIPRFGRIETDGRSRIWLPRTSIIPSLDPAIGNLGMVEGRVAVVGLSAEGLSNLTPTPDGLAYPHHIQARALQALIDGSAISRPWYGDFLEISIITLAGLLLFVLVPMTSVMLSIPLLVLSLSVVVAGPYFAWTNATYLLDPSWAFITILLVYGHSIYNNFARENRLKQQIKKQFEHYLAPAMVKKLQSNPGLLKLGGETRNLTLLFCDIRGFTPISEQYKTDPQGLTKLINRFLTPMTDIIMKNEGTIDKYMGDCIMAFWNAPLDVANQREKAVNSALEMLEHLNRLNAELAKDNLLPINIGIGLNTGSVVVGNMGSNQRFDYSCLGDAVNLASRLEGQSKGYGVKIIIGEETARGLDGFVTVELDLLAVKGKAEGVRVFTVLEKGATNGSIMAQHMKFLAAYRQQRWGVAKVIGSSLRTAWNGRLKDYYEIMLDRVNELQANPPGRDWDGVYRATSK
jgi:adenylate cyclase